MTRVITVASPKGGVSKTTLVAELVMAAAARGLKTLAIDADEQGNLSTRMGITPDTEIGATTGEVLMGDASFPLSVTPSPVSSQVSVLIGNPDLGEADFLKNKEHLVRDRFLRAGRGFDLVVIDTPPALRIISTAALAAADLVVAAVACEVEALDQVERLEAWIVARVAVPTSHHPEALRPGQQIGRVVPTRYDGRRRHDQEVLAELRERYPSRITQPVRESVVVKDAYSSALPVSAYAPSSDVAADFQQVATTILDQITGGRDA